MNEKHPRTKYDELHAPHDIELPELDASSELLGDPMNPEPKYTPQTPIHFPAVHEGNNKFSDPHFLTRALPSERVERRRRRIWHPNRNQSLGKK